MNKEKIIGVIRQIVETHKLTYAKILFSKKYAEISKFILEETAFLNIIGDVRVNTRVFCILNGITALPKCKICGKTICKNIIPARGFAVYCSPKCENSDSAVLKKQAETNLRLYGAKWSIQSENNRSKSADTMRKKYGTTYAQQNAEIKQKSVKTMLDRYGVKYPCQAAEFREKSMKANRRRMFEKISACGRITPLFSENEYVKCGNDFTYKWKCGKCGNVFESTVNMSWFKQGASRAYARCEKCYPYDAPASQEEIEVRDFLKTIYAGKIDTNVKCLRVSPDDNDTKLLELDILMPDIGVGIEYDGLFWHNDEIRGKSSHLIKTETGLKNNIMVIHVFSSDWLFKREIVESRLKNIIGVNDETFFARKCEIRETDSDTTRRFLEKNHIQGAVNAKINIGLFFSNELIALMTFGKSRFSEKYEWELLRFCTKLGCRVQGGAGKLLKYFEKTYTPKSLVSYADRRWSAGKLYTAIGFKFVKNSPPNYWYFKKGTNCIESRIKYQKHKLPAILKTFDPDKSEVENMKSNGYLRIFDCGNMVFEKIF